MKSIRSTPSRATSWSNAEARTDTFLVANVENGYPGLDEALNEFSGSRFTVSVQHGDASGIILPEPPHP